MRTQTSAALSQGRSSGGWRPLSKDRNDLVSGSVGVMVVVSMMVMTVVVIVIMAVVMRVVLMRVIVLHSVPINHCHSKVRQPHVR